MILQQALAYFISLSAEAISPVVRFCFQGELNIVAEITKNHERIVVGGVSAVGGTVSG